MKELIEEFYYLIFPRDEEGKYKTESDSPFWVKIVILVFILLMCVVLAFSTYVV
ncbi:hypothetical protein SAMN04488104_103027 [Algoriphagus faecimaris]|uniref:Uncharacterized protein n=1 Tax=Algoriphagus faecimaris TaxID=686796 RepID=A0A1G6USY4_9BACT|nr:hypothetical protein [Algoriphagus faecimaris]SDD44540.1 hypothetical protein SAMN04488104_103027 [Algoriphagus faecimaris]